MTLTMSMLMLNEMIFCHDREILGSIPVRYPDQWIGGRFPDQLRNVSSHTVQLVQLVHGTRPGHSTHVFPWVSKTGPLPPGLGTLVTHSQLSAEADSSTVSGLQMSASPPAAVLTNCEIRPKCCINQMLHNHPCKQQIFVLVKQIHKICNNVSVCPTFCFYQIWRDGQIACKQNNDDFALMKWALSKVV